MQNQLHIESNPLKGILICLLSYFFISLIGLSEKLIPGSVHISVILMFQNAICLLLSIGSLAKNNQIKELRTEHLGAYTIRIFAGLACYATLFYIIRMIPISEALLYQYSGALWIPFMMFVWLNVQVPKKAWNGIIIGFAGILLILKPTGSMLGVVSLLGILCGVLQAVTMVAARKLSVSEPIFRVLFYYFLIGTLVTAPLAFTHWTHLTSKELIALLGVGVSTYLAQKYLAISLKYASPATLAPVCYTSILFSGLIAWMVWHETPKNENLLGMFLIVAGCLATILVSNKKSLQIAKS